MSAWISFSSGVPDSASHVRLPYISPSPLPDKWTARHPFPKNARHLSLTQRIALPTPQRHSFADAPEPLLSTQSIKHHWRLASLLCLVFVCSHSNSTHPTCCCSLTSFPLHSSSSKQQLQATIYLESTSPKACDVFDIQSQKTRNSLPIFGRSTRSSCNLLCNLTVCTPTFPGLHRSSNRRNDPPGLDLNVSPKPPIMAVGSAHCCAAFAETF